MTGRKAPESSVEDSALPAWDRVLAVVAHPDDESFGLGAVLDAFVDRGARVSVLCLTEGESSTLGDVDDLRTVRRRELSEAAQTLGVSGTTLLHHPDGSLPRVRRHILADDVIDQVGVSRPDGLLVFDSTGVTGHPDHAAATSAAVLAAAVVELPVLAWTLPTTVAERLNEEYQAAFRGHRDDEIDISLVVDRSRQLRACEAHRSQAIPSSVLWRRLELLGDAEYLRWLRPPSRSTAPGRTADTVLLPGEPEVTDLEQETGSTVRVGHVEGDRFEIAVRDHVFTVDQPQALGGEDTAPTPTELLVASLVSCVAFYARRYLARHDLPTDGFRVEADYDLGRHPSRIRRVRIRLHLPHGLPGNRRDALLSVTTRCTVNNTLTVEPDVSISLVSPGTA